MYWNPTHPSRPRPANSTTTPTTVSTVRARLCSGGRGPDGAGGAAPGGMTTDPLTDDILPGNIAIRVSAPGPAAT